MEEKSRFAITVAADHIVVWQSGRLSSAAEAKALRRAVMTACEKAGVRRVIFDNRQTLAPDEAVRAIVWAWIGDPTQLERVALLLDSSMGVVRANMTALSQRVRLRAFDSFDEARAWLVAH